MQPDSQFRHLASVLLSREQMARLNRMDQDFEVVALCEDRPVHVIFRGSGRATYDLIYTNDQLRCSCPDAVICPDLRCKHQCWFIVRVGKGGVAAVQGDKEDLGKAVDAAAAALAEKMLRDAAKHQADEGRMGEDCPICYEELKTANTCCKCPDCGNHFHFACVALWLFHSCCCPMYRGKDWKDL